MQLNGQKKQAQQQLLRALHTFRERVKEQLTDRFTLKETLLHLTDFLSKLSYQKENLDQDNTTLSSYQPLHENLAQPQRHPTSSLKTIFINILLWFLSFVPKLQQRVKRYFETPQTTTHSEASITADITAAMTHFLKAKQNDSHLLLEENTISWSTPHQTPPVTTWPPLQHLRSNHPTTALTVFRENDTLDPSQAILCEIDGGERYLVPPEIAYSAIQEMQNESAEIQQEIFLELQSIQQKCDDWQAALPKLIKDKVTEELAELTKEIDENGKKLADREKKLADQGKKLADREKRLADQGKKLADQGNRLANQENRLGNQGKKLAAQEKKLADMDEMKAQLAMLMKKQKKKDEKKKQKKEEIESKKESSSSAGNSPRFRFGNQSPEASTSSKSSTKENPGPRG